MMAEQHQAATGGTATLVLLTLPFRFFSLKSIFPTAAGFIYSNLNIASKNMMVLSQ